MSSGRDTPQGRWRGGAATFGVAVAALVGALTAAQLFEQAVPQVRFTQRLTAPSALVLARAFASAHQLPFPEARTAVRFAEDDSLQLFLELAAPGGKAALDQVAADGDVALFRWTVRALTPGDVHETRVRLSPAGRVTGFWRRMAEGDQRPSLDSAAAHARALDVLGAWMKQDTAAWPLVAASHVIVPASARVDWSFTFERSDRRVAGAPLRLDVDLAGDLPSGAREYVAIPETFRRRYAEMRSSNDLLAQLAALGFPVYGLIALLALYRAQRHGTVRWRPAVAAATVIAGLMAASLANDLPSRWFYYPTTAPPSAFLLQQALSALLVPLLFGAFLTVVLAGGEVLTREAFPSHLDWWSTWRARGTPRLTRQVLSGYALGAVGLGYVAAFYYVTRHLLGWWVPSALLDDPNQIATPLPFLGAVANAAQAGVLEEVLFRAVPLSAVALLTRGRSWHRAAMASAVVVTALVFGFAHASYASWPAYSRGVELFAEAVLWAVIFLRVGLVPTVVCHFTFDLFLFGLFAMAGDAPAYRLTLAVVLAVMLAPAVLVLWARWRRASLAPAWDAVTFAAWRGPADDDPPTPPLATADAIPIDAPLVPVAPRGRDWRPLAILAGALALFIPRGTNVAEPRFTVDRSRAIAMADSVLRARGADLDGLTPTAEVLGDDDAEGARYLAHVERPALARDLARSYRALAGWGVSFDRREGTLAEKAEGWRLHLLPDGTPHDWRHVLAEDAERPAVERAVARRSALAVLVQAGLDTTTLHDAGVEEEKRPRRRDLVFTFEDRAVAIPGGASARVRVRVAGDTPISMSRSLHLPERWERADAERADRRGTIALVIGLLLAVLVMGVAFVMGRRPSLTHDALLTRRGAVGLLVAALLVLLVDGIAAWPAALAQWDTATPWRSHLFTTVLALVGRLFAILVPASLWMMTDALRRRAGVRAWAPGATALGSGVALGALAFAAARLVAWERSLGGTMVGPDTSLGLLWAPLGGALDVLTSAAVLPVVVAVPVMLFGGLVLPRRFRSVALVVAALALAAPGWFDGDARAARSPLVAIGGIVVLYTGWAAARWGRDGVSAWVVGACVLAALQQASAWPLAGHPADRAAAVVGVATAIALAVLVARAPRGAEADVSRR